MNKQRNIGTRELALKQRQALLNQNPFCFKGNTLQRKQYLDYLREINITLTDWQLEACVGLVLSDASMDTGADFQGQPTVRIKIQQNTQHEPFIKHVSELLEEYSGSAQALHPLKTRTGMFEFQTLRCEHFTPVAQLFAAQPLITPGKLEKKITPKLKEYITPVSVAYWFGGDGGKADSTQNKGKGISFHTQCFSKQECELLASFLQENIGLAAEVKEDNPKKAQYRVDVPGPSFEQFILEVSPYIHPSMRYKLPVPRETGSKFGIADKAFCDQLIASRFTDLNYITNYTRFSRS